MNILNLPSWTVTDVKAGVNDGNQRWRQGRDSYRRHATDTNESAASK
jgi:hypothetical protein